MSSINVFTVLSSVVDCLYRMRSNDKINQCRDFEATLKSEQWMM